MKNEYLTKFRDPQKAEYLIKAIKGFVKTLNISADNPYKIMEICGGHTHSIFRYGLEQLIPSEIEFIHGPGCPVCVLPRGRVDDCVALAEHPNVIFTTFGDAVRVPGSKKSLLQAKADGADVRIVYSPLDALTIAEKNPNQHVVFFALGFETTIPSTALTILQAKQQQIKNFSVFCNHITIIPAMKALLEDGDVKLDALIGPGHVSMVIGTEGFNFIAEKYGKPFVVSGFEPIDILQSVCMILEQVHTKQCRVENQYSRVVLPQGNIVSQNAIKTVYEDRPFFEWRGLGSIHDSGVRLREAFADFDAEKIFSVPNLKTVDPQQCQCGEVIKGIIKPRACKVFGKQCTPEKPLGALMVSSEGACAAYYSYGNLQIPTLHSTPL